MVRKPIKLILFFSSYFPLFFIFIVKNSFGSVIINIVLGIISFISIAVLYFFILVHRRIEGEYIKISSVYSRDSDATSYIVSYIIPFLSLDLTKISDKVSLGVLFIVIAAIYINSHMIHINPILNLIGYHIFEVEDVDGNKIILLTKKDVIYSQKSVKAINLSGNVYLKED